MTENEKAKAYDEALKKASAAHKDDDRHLKATLERIFPELKEDDDEKIKKDLIQWVDEFPDTIWRGHYKNDIIAWLEKQGDKDKLIQELGEYKVKYTQEVLEKHITSMSNKDDERLRKNTISFLKEFADLGYENAIECIDWLEKQGEQKSTIEMKSAEESLGISSEEYNKIIDKLIYDEQKHTDKVEPKFKVGDWITNDYCVGKVIELTNDAYLLDTGQDIPFSCKHNVHLWTIEDAKDGDVLACDINKAEIGGDVEKLPNIVSTIFNFKKLINIKDYIHSYCHLYDKRFLGLQRTMYYNSFVYNISPATKEQRELLFQKIKEAGYEWDTEKKELKKKEK